MSFVDDRKWYFSLLVMLACGLTLSCTEPELIPLQAAVSGDDASGVGLIERMFRVRVDETVSTEIYLPLGPDGSPLASPAPLVLSLHGGLVSPGQYQWLNVHMASRGFVVIAPEHALDLAIFEQGNTLDVVGALRRASARSEDPLYGLIDEGPALAIGHSLGGVVASRAWLDAPEEITHLVLLSSLPNPSDNVGSRIDDNAFVLSLTGAEDGRITVDEVIEGAAEFQAPTTVAVVEGMNHFQLVDAATSSQWESDGPATISTLEARRLVLEMVDEALKSLESGEDDFFQEPSRWPEGVRHE